MAGMMSLSPEEFEHFVADVWEARGFETEVTQVSNDAGTDVVAKRDGRRVAIQAKRYQRSNRVSGPEVQQYGSILHDETIDDVVIATSGTFTNAAYRRAQEIGVDLVDGERLLTLADRYSGSKQPETSTKSSDPPIKSESSSSSGSGIFDLLIGFPIQLMIMGTKLAISITIAGTKLAIWMTLLPFKLLFGSNDD